MDEFYDIARAYNMVQKYAEESMDTNPYHMSRIIKVSLQKDADDFVWRLVKGSNDEAEELVFACTGVVCKVNLPPLVRAPSVGCDKAITLSQSITVTGLGSASFDNAIATLQEIKLTAEREFKHGMLDKWSPSTCRGFPAFTLSNRYFRAMKEGGQHKAVPFSNDVDPIGILQRLGKTDVVHTEDNVVQYFKAQTDDEGKRRFQRARPQLFRIGDVVEVQCSVIVFKAKGTRHRMKLVLRAIALLDCDITLDAKRKSNKLSTVEQSGSRRLKRKIGFVEDEVDEGMASKKAREGPTMDEST
ncbi:hypothetical protein IW261DRAFT_1423864 [Armillaria novae-zelandiae]|uniref:Uncharacterized protein n=1 Tax=Armillaria novae-zelandiae TaxID=153914 RepID=A0AA39TXW5_9AGAR|nr:hypothetical protein IW261DRAFT_1423864 [Armillaria novae-zelandiae]